MSLFFNQNNHGAPDWDRTSDLQLRKLTLFQLSYGYKTLRIIQENKQPDNFRLPENYLITMPIRVISLKFNHTKTALPTIKWSSTNPQ